ncbi:AMP-binding protein [Nocardia sp. NPDC049149]|uniref:AMP-binding protein n=1 Tax=Nocardia sp. NPDC049149 TaxID=3364315 RepID=UPI0037191D89
MNDVVANYEGDHAPAHEYAGENGEWTTLSRHDLLRAVQSSAQGWREAGLQAGDRVAVEATDPHIFVPAFLGALWAGVVPVPVPPTAGSRAAWSTCVAAMARAAQANAIALRAGTEPPTGSGRPIVLDTVVAASPEKSDPYRPGPDETAYVQFSGGRTGNPRGIPARVGAVQAYGMAIMRDGLQSGPATDRGLSWLPLHHDMGLVGFVLAPLLVRVPVSFMPTRSFVRDPGLWLRAISERRATISFAPNFAFDLSAHRISPEEAAALDLSHVYVLGCGAEPINNSVLQRFLNTFAPAGLNPEALTPCYGLTEATFAVTLSPASRRYRTDHVQADALSAGHATPIENVTATEGSDGVETLVSCGPPLRGHRIVIRDTTGATLGERAVGEIWVSGPSVAHAYLGADPEAHNSIGPDGWLRTGDLGYLADGELFVTSRVSEST